MAQSDVTEEELAELIERTGEAAKAYIRGDMRTYFTLIQHGDDYTLMPRSAANRPAASTPHPSASTPWSASFAAAKRNWRSCRPTPPAIWSCWW